jgi:PST family polysaccharide transporter
LIKVGAVLLAAPLLVFAGLEALEMALIGLALTLVYFIRRRDVDVGRPSASFDSRRLLKEAFPLLLASLAAMIYMRADVLILASLKGYGLAGIYSAAAQITEACALLPVALSPALLPVVVKWQTAGLAFYRRQFEKLFLAASLLGIFASVILTLTAPILIHVVYGPSFALAAKILTVHAWSAVFIFIGIIQTGYEVTARLTWWTAARTALGAITNVALNFMFIPRFGAIGAAVATLIAFAGSGFLFNLIHPASRPIFFMQARALILAPLAELLMARHAPLPENQLVNPGRAAR